MADEFDQYKVSSASEDDFAQYKVPSSSAITPPPAAGPHIDVQPESVSGFINRVTGHPNYQSQPITPQGIVRGAASDLWTLDKSGAQAVAHGATMGKSFPLGKPDTEQVTRAGVNVGTGMLLGGLEGEGIAPTQGLNDAINGSPKTPGLSPTLSVASKLVREFPIIGGVLRKFDLLKDLIPEQNVPRGTPSGTPIIPQSEGVPWGTQLPPKPVLGPRAPTYQVNTSQGTPLPSVLEGQNPVNMRTTYPPEPTPPVSKPARPAPTWQTNPSEGTELKVQGSTPEDIKAQLQRMANRPRTPAQPPTDPWANLKFDKAAQEQARTELGANADTTRVLERAQEIKTQMMQQGSQYQVVKVGTLPKAKGNPFSGPNTPSAMEPAQSTNISLHGYHPESQTMVVQFKNGNVYSYKGVPQEIFDNYRKSESQGSFFANNIKGRYQTELRGTVKPTPGVRVKQALGGQP